MDKVLADSINKEGVDSKKKWLKCIKDFITMFLVAGRLRKVFGSLYLELGRRKECFGVLSVLRRPTSEFIRMSRCSKKMIVASKRHEELYWFKPEPYVHSQR